MRVMFAVFPAPAHFLPMVPYAWALQAAGHEVCVAAPPGIDTGVAVPDFQKAVMAAGLAAVPCGEPELLAVHDRAYPEFAELLPNAAESERFVQALGLDATNRAPWDMFYCFMVLAARDYHPPALRQDIAALVEFARDWRPDLVLWDPWFPSGAVAARVSGAAHARVLNNPDYAGFVHDRFARAEAARAAQPAGRPGPGENPMVTTVRPLAEHYGLQVDDELLLGQWTIDPFQPGMRLPTSARLLPVRYVPYTGASVMPQWLRVPPQRPRVGISLGVSARNFLKGDWGRTAKLLDAVAGLDIEVIATLNANQLMDVPGGVPDNVRTFDYVPLTQLLPTCTALIHHGSLGTFAAACAANLPQLICDTDESTLCFGTPTDDGIHWDFQCEKQLSATATSTFVTERGAGVRLNHQVQSADEIRQQLVRVLEEPSFQAGAQSVYDEWLATPSPSDIVADLEKLTAQHRSNRSPMNRSPMNRRAAA